MITEIAKFFIIGIGFVSLIGGLACLLQQSPHRRPWCISALIILTALPESAITLTLFSQDWYRGHTRGWEFSVIDMFAAGMIAGLIGQQTKSLVKIAPLALLWGLYCLTGILSAVNALDHWFWAVAVLKYCKAILPMLAIYLAFQNQRDFHAIITGIAAALIIETLPGLYQRYGHGIWRVQAWFEHSNPLAMWSYMFALPILGHLLTPRLNWQQNLFIGLSYISGLGLIIVTLARASLGAAVIGSALVIGLRILTYPTRRVFVIIVSVASIGLIMAAISVDSIAGRIAAEKEYDDQEDFRSVLNRQSAVMLADNSLGVGWNNYGIANSRPHGKKYCAVIERWDISRGHIYGDKRYGRNALVESVYWLQLAEVGYLGCISYVLFKATSLLLALLAIRRHRKKLAGGLILGITVALGIAYGHGYFERILVQTKNLAQWMMLLGIISRLAWYDFESPASSSAPPSPARSKKSIAF